MELSEAVLAPAASAENPGAERRLPEAAFFVAFVPDEDPDLKPAVHIHSHDERVIPYEIMRWFMEQGRMRLQRAVGTRGVRPMSALRPGRSVVRSRVPAP
ncbi:hypothetical protein [Streptomyces rochei]|uniref:hypothetical protein n=1 Tax=Streptomyces rochei TaxID=1928 RepID=UPI0022E9E12F|nr:hypothetical protein [Streptomyces rochei]MCC8452871.1 hypothetical protein [Streptomyces rochei]